MALERQKKAFQSGIRNGYRGMRRVVRGITGAGSSPRHVIKLPVGATIGKVYYTVESSLDPITFAKRKDAECFKKMLGLSVNPLQADIIRREITDEGYIPTYPKKD